MDPAERIADYLSDDLTPDERAAFEADLDGDAALRAQLEAARRADAALSEITPIALPDGFTDRLRDAVDAELADLLAPTAAAAGDPRVAAQAELALHDDLAARRAARTPPRWTGFIGAAAAAVLVVVAGVAGLSTLSGGGDDSAAGESDTDAMAARPESAELQNDAAEEAPAEESAESGESAGDGGEAADAETWMAPEPADEDAEAEGGADVGRYTAGESPLLLAANRTLEAADLDTILIGPELQEIAGQQLEPPAAGELAAAWRQALVTLDDAAARQDGDVAVHERGPVTEADRAAVASCVATALDTGDDAIPVYTEVADYAGRPAVILGLVVPDPRTGTFSRTEVQALDRDTCSVLATRP